MRLTFANRDAGDVRSQGRLSPAYKDVERPIGAQLRQHTFTPSRGATTTNSSASNGGSSDNARSDYPDSPARGGAASYPLAHAAGSSPQKRDVIKDLASSSKDLKATLESLSASFKVGGAAGNSPSYAKKPSYTSTAAGRDSPHRASDSFSRGGVGATNAPPPPSPQQQQQPQSPAGKSLASSPPCSTQHSPVAQRQSANGHKDIFAHPAPSPTKKDTSEPRVLQTEQRIATSPLPTAAAASSAGGEGGAKNWEWGVSEVALRLLP